MSRTLLVVLLGGALLSACSSCKKDETKPETSAGSAQAGGAPARDVPDRTVPPRRDARSRTPPGITRPPGPPVGLSEEERAQLVEERRALRAQRQAENVARYDADGDGTLSDAERATMRAARVQDRFVQLDTDGDGALTPAELEGGGRGRRAPFDFASADTDASGTLSPAELETAMRAARGGIRQRVDRLTAPPTK